MYTQYLQYAQVAFVTSTMLWLLYCIILSVYRLYFHPLSRFPGPKMAAVSEMWFAIEFIRGGTHLTLANEHRKYGPIVRTAPGELSILHIDAHRQLYKYGQKNVNDKTAFHKAPAYNNGNVSNIFSETDPEVHNGMRKMFSTAFSAKALRDQEYVIHQYVDLFIEQLGKLGRPNGPGLNITEAVEWLTFDLTGDLAFGEPFDAVSSGKSPFWVTILNEAFFLSLLNSYRKKFAVFTLILLWSMPKNFLKKMDEHSALTQAKVRKRIEMSGEKNREDFFDNIIRNKSLKFESMVSQSSILIIAGADTTSTFLASVFYLLLNNPQTLKKATSEVRSQFESFDDINGDRASQLKYLNAVIEEGLRIYPPAPSLLNRVVPPGGATIAGEFIPGGTIVGVPTWAMHRSDKFWHKPDEFIPERWIGDGLGFGDTKEASKPFSLGPRGCIGINLAYLEMRVVLSKILFTYDMEIAPQSQGFDFIKASRSHGLWFKPPFFVKFHPRQT